MSQEFTPEQVDRAAERMRVQNLDELEVERMLHAYAATLRQQAARGDAWQFVAHPSGDGCIVRKGDDARLSADEILAVMNAAALSAQPAPEHTAAPVGVPDVVAIMAHLPDNRAATRCEMFRAFQLSAAPPAPQGTQQGEDVVDCVAKALADAIGHGMREKCEPLAHAAIAAYLRATSTTHQERK